jgi:hypothetical protein
MYDLYQIAAMKKKLFLKLSCSMNVFDPQRQCFVTHHIDYLFWLLALAEKIDLTRRFLAAQTAPLRTLGKVKMRCAEQMFAFWRRLCEKINDPDHGLVVPHTLIT